MELSIRTRTSGPPLGVLRSVPRPLLDSLKRWLSSPQRLPTPRMSPTRRPTETTIQEAPSQQVLDDMTAAQIEREIRRRTGQRIEDLDVSVEEGVVTLRGRATSYFSRQIALHVAIAEIKNHELCDLIEVR